MQMVPNFCSNCRPRCQRSTCFPAQNCPMVSASAAGGIAQISSTTAGANLDAHVVFPAALMPSTAMIMGVILLPQAGSQFLRGRRGAVCTDF